MSQPFNHKCPHCSNIYDNEELKEAYEEKRDMEKAEEDVYQISENIFAVEMGSPDNWGIVNGKERATNEDMDDEKVSPDEFASACEHEICLKINEKITELNGWLEISTSIYGSTQPTLNATFWYREDAVQFAYWYKKQW